MQSDPLAYIPSRIKAGEEHMAPFTRKSTKNANRYLDSSSKRLSSLNAFNDGKPDSLPVGEINYMAMNIRQKVAASTIANPDWVVECTGENQDAAPVVREYIRKWWHKKKWNRVFRRALTSRFITGLGVVAYMWDAAEGFTVEYVRPDDFVIDPHTTDEGWDNPRWAARKIKLPCDEAYKRYGDQIDGVWEGDINSAESAKKSVDIWIYYDQDYEAEVWNGKVLGEPRPNLYGRVPMRIICGDPNPDGEFPLGDYDTSLGVFEGLRKQHNILNGIASHGGARMWIRSDFIDPKVKESVLDGSHQGPIPVSGVPGESALGYVSPEPINEATLSTINLLMDGLRSDQGVIDLDTGVTDNSNETATQTAIRSTRSGARANLLRSECEGFVEDVVNDMVRISALFGLDPSQDPDEDDILVWEALTSVLEVRIVEESMMFRDPGQRQQQSMQLFQLATSSFELMNQLGFAPNLKKLFDDVLRSFDRRDVDQYYLPTPGIMGGQGGQENPQEEMQPGDL